MRQVADQDIFWLEEPVPTDDVAGSAEIAQALDVPVAGYESETGLGGFRDLIERKAVDIVQPDVIWTGGITECKKGGGAGPRPPAAGHPPRLLVGGRAIANMHFIASIPNGGLLGVRPEPEPAPLGAVRGADRGRQRQAAVGPSPGSGVTLNQARSKVPVETDPTPV
jgi:L-alanine-DL-glutamate epimerase-like enolase superfamily enzyme